MANKFAECIECPVHRVIPDPDPSDSFNYDDCAIVCALEKNEEQDLKAKYVADRNPFKIVEACLRPYEVSKVKSPKWCPLKK